MPGRLRWILLFSFLGSSCSLLADTDLENGVGAKCQSDSDCHRGACDRGICVTRCTTDVDCPSPARCFASLCQLPLRVGVIGSGVKTGGDGWTQAHYDGMEAAASSLAYLSFGDARYRFDEQVRTEDGVRGSVDGFVAEGADVIVTTSLSQRDALIAKADQYSGIKFLTCGGFKPNDRNLGSFFGRYEQIWYVGGKVAALVAKHRIGFIAPLSAPGVVRFVNAFTLGARSVNPGVVVEVRWLGFWTDLNKEEAYPYTAQNYDFATTDETLLYREELLTAQLVDAGAEVVVHQTDTQRSVTFIEDRLGGKGAGGITVYSMAADIRDGCRVQGKADTIWQPSCLASMYWNWGAVYTTLFDEMHRGVWRPEDLIVSLRTDRDQSPFFINLNDYIGISQAQVQSFIVEVAAEPYNYVFRGPYATTGQRDADADGVADPSQNVPGDEVLSDAELARMCWFVDGVVQKADYLDPSSDDVPALVPDGPDGIAPPPDDVVEYAASYPFIDLDRDMNCPEND